MKTVIRFLLLVVIAVVVIGIFSLLLLRSREWRPAPIEPIFTAELPGSGGLTADILTLDTIKIVSWNIGYAGLGDDMDFFMDGGKSTRTSEERAGENLQGILSFLKQHADADFILLQEVDFDSQRSYRTNQYDSIRSALPAHFGWFAYNYVSDWVPVPLLRPMGTVKSGLVMLSKWIPEEVIRLQYPSEVSFPRRLFDLKRALLSGFFPLDGGRTLSINNTHNSAYDDGSQREKEYGFLRQYLEGKHWTVTMGDWNGVPPGYSLEQAAAEDRHFRPNQLQTTDFPIGCGFVYDPTTPSVRYLDKPYVNGENTTTLIDFAVTGPGMMPLSIETVDLGFCHSDHNPVVGRFFISR